jgi:hypothetical protein
MSVTTILKDITKNHDETLKYLNDINLKYEEVINSLGLLSSKISSPNTINDIIKNVSIKESVTEPKKQEDETKNINAIILDKKKVTFSNMYTTNSSEISKNIMTHIFNVYKEHKDTDFIEKYLQSGEKDGIKSLIYCISNLFKLMRIFNQDFFMRLLTIISEKDVFDEMFDLINKNFSDKDERKTFLIDSFFLKFDNTIYDTIKIIYNQKKEKQQPLDQKFKRDTTMYNMYNKSNRNDKIILMNQFLYDFIELNNDENLKKLLVNTTRGNDVANLLTDLIDNVLKLKEIYLNYVGKIDTINEYYKKIVDKHSRIFSYVKYRQDTNTVNPRYSVYYDKNKYLYLRYCNIDGRIGFKKNDDDTSYDYNLAIEYINENLSKNEYYTFGPFNGIFSKENDYLTNDKIAVEFSEKILQKLIDEKQNVCVIPWGQSGSGKTSSVIYFSVYNPITQTTTKMDGVMVEVCNLDRFTNHFGKIQMNMKNIYLQHGPNDYKIVDLAVTYKKGDLTKKDSEPTFIFKDGHWVFEQDNNIWMSESINNAFDNREVEPTPNNENSSRSHVIVCLKLFVKDSDESVNLIVCDLAGVENKFQIHSLREIKKFDERYKISNKYKSSTEKIKFDNYFRNDNEESTKYSHIDEYTKYNDSKKKLENTYKKYVKFFTSKNDGGGNFSDFNDIDFLETEKLSCSNTLSNIDINKYKNTNEYISILEEDIEKIHEETLIAQKEYKLYHIMKKLGIFNIIETEKDSKVREQKITKIIKEKFLGTKEDINIDNKDNFESYVKENELKNYVDLVKYLIYIGKINLKVVIKPTEFKLFTNFENNIVKNITESRYFLLKEQYLAKICELGRVLKIYYNGMLRVNEGIMINKSLKELKDDLKLLVLKSFVNPKTGTLPFIFDKEVFPYCRNLYSDENIYEKFYTMPDKNNTKLGKIIEVIKSFGVDVSILNFAVFTVINLSDYFKEKNKVTNNPPNPPYININNLIYLRNIQKIFPDIGKLQSEINIILKKLEEYEFYNNLDVMKELRKRYKESNPTTLNQFLDIAKSLIELIQPNNSATLIGTLADTDSIQNITLADQFPCAENNNLFEERNKFGSEFNLIEVETPSKFKEEMLLKSIQITPRPSKSRPKKDGKKKKSIKFRSKRRYNKL